jgi:hypothetical protein
MCYASSCERTVGRHKKANPTHRDSRPRNRCDRDYYHHSPLGFGIDEIKDHGRTTRRRSDFYGERNRLRQTRAAPWPDVRRARPQLNSDAGVRYAHADYLERNYDRI